MYLPPSNYWAWLTNFPTHIVIPYINLQYPTTLARSTLIILFSEMSKTIIFK
jgi:hypothetical protein